MSGAAAGSRRENLQEASLKTTPQFEGQFSGDERVRALFRDARSGAMRAGRTFAAAQVRQAERAFEDFDEEGCLAAARSVARQLRRVDHQCAFEAARALDEVVEAVSIAVENSRGRCAEHRR